MDSLLNKRLEGLKRSTDRFLKIIEGHSPEQRQVSPASESWNMLQVIEHISGSEKNIADNFVKRPPAESPYKTNFRMSIKSFLLGLVLKSPIKVKAPSVLTPPIGNLSFETYKEKWEAVRNRIVEAATNMPEDKMNLTVMKHPVAGPLTFPQTIEFMSNHIDNHYRQLQRISKQIKSK